MFAYMAIFSRLNTYNQLTVRQKSKELTTQGKNGWHENDVCDLDEKLIVEKMSNYKFLVHLHGMTMGTLTVKNNSYISLPKKTINFPRDNNRV